MLESFPGSWCVPAFFLSLILQQHRTLPVWYPGQAEEMPPFMESDKANQLLYYTKKFIKIVQTGRNPIFNRTIVMIHTVLFDKFPGEWYIDIVISCQESLALWTDTNCFIKGEKT